MEKLNGVEKRASRDFIGSLGYRDVGTTFSLELSFGGVRPGISAIVSGRHLLSFKRRFGKAVAFPWLFVAGGIRACNRFI